MKSIGNHTYMNLLNKYDICLSDKIQIIKGTRPLIWNSRVPFTDNGHNRLLGLYICLCFFIGYLYKFSIVAFTETRASLAMATIFCP